MAAGTGSPVSMWLMPDGSLVPISPVPVATAPQPPVAVAQVPRSPVAVIQAPQPPFSVNPAPRTASCGCSSTSAVSCDCSSQPVKPAQPATLIYVAPEVQKQATTAAQTTQAPPATKPASPFILLVPADPSIPKVTPVPFPAIGTGLQPVPQTTPVVPGLVKPEPLGFTLVYPTTATTPAPMNTTQPSHQQPSANWWMNSSQPPVIPVPVAAPPPAPFTEPVYWWMTPDQPPSSPAAAIAPGPAANAGRTVFQAGRMT